MVTNILKPSFTTGFKYYDVKVDDKKLVNLNIDDAKKMLYPNKKLREQGLEELTQVNKKKVNKGSLSKQVNTNATTMAVMT